MQDQIWVLILTTAISSGFLIELLKTFIKRWNASKGKKDRYKLDAMKWEYLTWEARSIAEKLGATSKDFSATPRDVDPPPDE